MYSNALLILPLTRLVFPPLGFVIPRSYRIFYCLDSIHDYLLNNNVQHGGSYATSKKCMDLYAEGYKAAASYINASVTEIGQPPNFLYFLAPSLSL